MIDIALGVLICLLSVAWSLFWYLGAEACSTEGKFNTAAVGCSIAMACLGLGGLTAGLKVMGVF